MMILLTIGAAAAGVVVGFFIGTYIRQQAIAGLTEANRALRNELSLTRGIEGRFQMAVADLKSQLEDMRETLN